MPAWAPQKSQRAVFRALAYDSTLQTLLGGVNEVQTITLSAAPVAGVFKLGYLGTLTANIDGATLSAANIQTALRAITGLEAVVVAAVSSTVYTVTMYEVPGDVALLTVSANTTGVTITPSETTKGVLKVFDFVPQNTSYPYVVLQILPFLDRGNYTYEGWECEFQITTWYRSPGRGNKDLQDIQAQIDNLLHKASLCVDDWNTTHLRRTFVDILTMEDGVTKQGIQRFKLQLGEG